MEGILEIFEEAFTGQSRFWALCWILAAIWTVGATSAAIARSMGVRVYAPSVNLTLGIAFALHLIPSFLYVAPKSNTLVFRGIERSLEHAYVSIPVFTPFLCVAIIVVLMVNLYRLIDRLHGSRNGTDGLGYRLLVMFLILANWFWLDLVSRIDL